MADIKGKLTSSFGLKDKLALLAGGANLSLPEIGETLVVKCTGDLQIAKSGTAFMPLTVTPVIDDVNKERYRIKFDLVEGNEYKFFLPLIGREHMSKYMKEVNNNITGALVHIKVDHWANYDPKKVKTPAELDDQGRAKSASIVGVIASSDIGERVLEDIEAQIGNITNTGIVG